MGQRIEYLQSISCTLYVNLRSMILHNFTIHPTPKQKWPLVPKFNGNIHSLLTVFSSTTLKNDHNIQCPDLHMYIQIDSN